MRITPSGTQIQAVPMPVCKLLILSETREMWKCRAQPKGCGVPAEQHPPGSPAHVPAADSPGSHRTLLLLPKICPVFCVDPRGAKHHVLGTGCCVGAVPGAGSIFPARGDPEEGELCLPKVGHAVNSSDVVGRAKNTVRAEPSLQLPEVRLGPHRVTPRAADARLGEEQGMERPL